MATCYRHSSRETGVSCSACGRPICPDCMTPTSVGMRCPECARERTKVRTSAHLKRAAEPLAAYVLIGINVLVYLGANLSRGGDLLGSHPSSYAYVHGVLFGPSIAHQHEYWRLITSGFLHYGPLHLAFNMYFIFVIGHMIEPAIGRSRFVAVYFASLLCGSFGALALTPLAPTVGASGAAFGLLGCTIAVARARGISLWESGLGVTLGINVVLGLTISGISIGGHLGGLAGGLVAGAIVLELGERRGSQIGALLGCAVVGAAGVLGALAVAGKMGLAPNGLHIGLF